MCYQPKFIVCKEINMAISGLDLTGVQSSSDGAFAAMATARKASAELKSVEVLFAGFALEGHKSYTELMKKAIEAVFPSLR
jgi:hypothetical protein